MFISLWMLVTGLIGRMFKVASIALTKFVYWSWSIFNLFVLNNDRILWLLLSFGAVYVYLLLLNATSATDWAWRDKTGRDKTQSYVTGHVTVLDMKQPKRNKTGRNRTGQDVSVRGCSWWVEFNSSVGLSFFVCMYIKLYYFLVTDLSEKYQLPWLYLR